MAFQLGWLVVVTCSPSCQSRGVWVSAPARAACVEGYASGQSAACLSAVVSRSAAQAGTPRREGPLRVGIHALVGRVDGLAELTRMALPWGVTPPSSTMASKKRSQSRVGTRPGRPATGRWNGTDRRCGPPPWPGTGSSAAPCRRSGPARSQRWPVRCLPAMARGCRIKTGQLVGGRQGWRPHEHGRDERAKSRSPRAQCRCRAARAASSKRRAATGSTGRR